jgi:microcompartment protein CcmK/EutM
VRIGIVRGTVVLSQAVPELKGSRLLVVEPVTAENLRPGTKTGGGISFIAADHLAPACGQLVGIVEGREAANAYWPEDAPVDAYCALIVDHLDYNPPRLKGKRSK